MKKQETESAKEIGVWIVACWAFIGLAVFFSIFSAVITIKAGQIFVGLLFFIPGIFAAVPKKYLRISRPLKVIIFILVYFTLIIISGLNAPQPEQQYEYYMLGESFNLSYGDNTFSMEINNISKETQMILHDGQNLTTSGFYLFVNGGVKNLGKNPLDFNFESELKDNQNNSYSLLAFNFGTGVLQPNLERKFSNIFEIPKDISGLRFIVKDKTKIIKLINLER